MISKIKQYYFYLHAIHLFNKGFSGFNAIRAVEKGFISGKQADKLRKRFPNDVLGGKGTD